MASTITLDEQPVDLGQSLVLEIGTVSLGTYATGGVAIDDTGDIDWIRAIVGGSGGYTAEYIKSSKLVKVYRQKDPAAAGGADIPLPEVANGVDLSAVNFPFIAVRTK